MIRREFTRAQKAQMLKRASDAQGSIWCEGCGIGTVIGATLRAIERIGGDNGWFGWQDDKQIEELKVKFAQAGSDAEKKKLAEQLQLRAIETATHVHLGQYNNPAALRDNISGLVPAGAQVYWNIKKN